MVLLPKKYILVQRRKEVSGSMEKPPKKYPSLKEVAPVTLVAYIKIKISLQDPCPLHWLQKEMFRGFILVEKYKLDSLKKYVLNEISASLIEFKVEIEMIKDLPVELVK